MSLRALLRLIAAIAPTPLLALPLAAAAQVVLGDMELKGPVTKKAWVKGAAAAKTSSVSLATFDVDGAGDVTYASPDFGFVGRIDTSGRKAALVLDVMDVDSEIVKTVASLAPGFTGVTLTRTSVKPKLAVDARGGVVTAKLRLTVAYKASTDQGDIKGRIALMGLLSTAPVCAVCGATFTGQERFERSLAQCGRESGRGPASLTIASDADDDGVSAFVYTGEDGVPVTGNISQLGNRLECEIDGAGVDAIDGILEDALSRGCSFPDFGSGYIVVDDTFCSATSGRGGNSVRFSFEAEHHTSPPVTSPGSLMSNARLVPATP